MGIFVAGSKTIPTKKDILEWAADIPKTVAHAVTFGFASLTPPSC
jgi:hypothetical protein